MKKQAVIISGGDCFESYDKYIEFLRNFKIDIERFKTEKKDWKSWLRAALGETFEVIIPVMPNKSNAQFNEWKLWFEKFIPYINDGVMLIGHSLGGSFLAKYLSENNFPKKLSAVFLVAPAYDFDADGYSVATFTLPDKLNLQTDKIFIYHSKDDPVVPFESVNKFKAALPKAVIRVLENRGHINDEQFLELVADIKSLNDDKKNPA